MSNDTPDPHRLLDEIACCNWLRISRKEFRKLVSCGSITSTASLQRVPVPSAKPLYQFADLIKYQRSNPSLALGLDRDNPYIFEPDKPFDV